MPHSGSMTVPHVTPRPLIGVLCVMAAAALWGTTGTSQALAGGGLSSLWFGALRLCFAALFFAVFAAVTQPWLRRAWQGLAPRDALGAGLCMAVYNLAFFAGVKLTGVAIGTAIALGSGPIWRGSCRLYSSVNRPRPPGGWGPPWPLPVGCCCPWAAQACSGLGPACSCV